MYYQAERTRLVIKERQEPHCPRSIVRLYSHIVRLAAVFLAMPTMLALCACIFHIPILPLFVLLFSIWGLRGACRVTSRTMVRWLWPIHSRWLLMRRPGSLRLYTNREVRVHKTPLPFSLNLSTGALRVGDQWLDLLQKHSLDLERAEDQGHQLRLRLYQEGQEPVILGSRLTLEMSEKLEALEQLPRKEGSAVMLHEEEFPRFLSNLARIEEAQGNTFPAELRSLMELAGMASKEEEHWIEEDAPMFARSFDRG